MPFDFSTYLQNQLSAGRGSDQAAGEPFTVEILTGGLMNHTARVKFASPLLDIGGAMLIENGGIQSAILKHAPPYIATVPNQPMSVDRQLTEKTALRILSGEDSGANFPHIQAVVNRYRQAGTRTSIQIPRYIWHDMENDVLWIEDLGEMKTLCQILLLDGEAAVEASHIQEFATVLGEFMSELFQATANPPDYWVAQANSPESLSLYNYLTGMVLQIFREVENMTKAEALLLSERAENALLTKAEAEDICLGMVDFWPGNILVEPGQFGRCGLIDWEYFGLTSASSELGMLRKLLVFLYIAIIF